MKSVKLTESDLNRIVKRVLSEEAEEANYMFFSNLKQMKRQLEMMMEMDPSAVDHIIQNGHDWADDHISEAKTNMDQVFDFIMNEKDDTHGDEMIIDDVMENKKTIRITEDMLEAIIRRVIREKEKDTTLCERGITAAKAKYDVYPSAYANGYAVQVCKGDMPDVNGVKKCSGKYCSGK